MNKQEIISAFDGESRITQEHAILQAERKRLEDELGYIKGRLIKITNRVNSHHDRVADRLDKEHPNWRKVISGDES